MYLTKFIFSLQSFSIYDSKREAQKASSIAAPNPTVPTPAVPKPAVSKRTVANRSQVAKLSHHLTTDRGTPFSDMFVTVTEGVQQWSDSLVAFRTTDARDKESRLLICVDFCLKSSVDALSDHNLSPFGFDASKSQLIGISPAGTAVEFKYPATFHILLKRYTTSWS
ncbi:hypothetical protein BP5796_03010 [Coleophoma crateriformis]|uniref:Uncharacterized protein n=1 Tax=Coleophoma crateriformis TaxID=565419 RepID=A0A3D8SM13_9HELO|nr:hypothetical protein BP5796_03010 [Coleophoma crateriformis]